MVLLVDDNDHERPLGYRVQGSTVTSTGLFINFYYFDVFDSPANNILELFPFQFMDSTFERWFRSYQFGYVVHDEVSGWTNIFYCILPCMVNNKKAIILVVFSGYLYGVLSIYYHVFSTWCFKNFWQAACRPAQTVFGEVVCMVFYLLSCAFYVVC